ncbi:MAG: hypothetical protein ACYDHH_01350 [Solirubrobacteraceae bacterium]
MTLAVGLLIKAFGGELGTALPPLVMSYSPELDPLAVMAVVVLAGGAALVPRLLARDSSTLLTAAGLYCLALALGLTLNASRIGIHDWLAVFDTRHGTYEALFEYLTGLSPLVHGVHYFVENFGSLFAYLPTHAKGNPPGPLVALHLLGIDRAGALAWLCILFGALSAPLAYDLGRTLGDERRGRVAGVLTAFTPAIMLFGVTSVDYAFTAMGMAVACLLARRSPAALVAGGAAAGVISFFSWLLLAIPAFSALLAWRRFGLRQAALVAAAATAGIVGFDLLLAAVWGYDPFSALNATRHAYAGGISRTRPYGFWLFGSPSAWALMLGPAVLWFLLVALGEGEASAIALIAVIVAAAVIGVTKAETERIWLPFVPLAAVAAAASMPRRWLQRALWLMAAQGLATEVLFYTIW